jgi:hypothetical protein
MNKLEELYSALNSLKKFNLPIEDKLLKAVDELEEEIIKTEVLPSITKDIEPRLRQIKRKLVLVVDYDPDDVLSVKLSRKVNISKLVEGKNINESFTASVPRKEIQRCFSNKSKPKGLVVTYRDGTEICERTAIETFIKVLRDIGLSKIKEIGIMHGEHNLIDTKKIAEKSKDRWQYKVDDYYVYVILSNAQKMKDLLKISDYFHLGLDVRFVE